MATPRMYAQLIRAASKRIARKFGLGIDMSDKTVRALAATNAIQFGILLKLLEDKGYLTVAEVQSYFETAAAEDYPDEPVQPPE